MLSEYHATLGITEYLWAAKRIFLVFKEFKIAMIPAVLKDFRNILNSKQNHFLDILSTYLFFCKNF